jgi:Tfp pilus assembly protein PilN
MKAVNLLPPDLRGTPKTSTATAAPADRGSGFAAYAVLGALALSVAGVAGYVLTNNTIEQRQADLAQATAAEQAAQARAARLKPYADFDQLAKARVTTVRDLAGRRFDWEQALRDISRAIPGNVTLKTLSGSISPESGGNGNSALRGAIQAPAITLSGCTTDQKSVAGLMSRLHGVDGVTRVSLAKSEKKQEKNGGGSGSAPIAPSGETVAAPSSDSEGCGPGSPPEFELVMFFENDAAASADATPRGESGGKAADGGPAQPSATATPAPGGNASTASTTQGDVAP